MSTLAYIMIAIGTATVTWAFIRFLEVVDKQ